MSQLLAVILIVVAATLYVLWILAPRTWRQRLGLAPRKSAVVGSGQGATPGCGCGSGKDGCH